MRIELSEAECLAILGVSATASAQDIQEAHDYHHHINHPDNFQSDSNKAHAAENLKRVTQAYERLKEIRGQQDGGTDRKKTGEKPPIPDKTRSPGLFRWWRWRSGHEPGPPPRCSPDTKDAWPQLPSVHPWWLQPCEADLYAPQEDALEPRTLTPEDSDNLPTATTLFVAVAKDKGLTNQLYWAAEAEQNAKVCYLRFLKPILGDVCVNVEAVIAKQMNLTYIEFKVGTLLWWRPSEALRRLRLRSVAVLVWLGFCALAQMTLPNGTGAGAISLAVAGLFILAWAAHWDFRVDYGKVDWKCFYPFALWWSRFEIPLMIQMVCFFAWRQWGVINGNDPGARVVYLPILIWLIGHCLWKSAWPVDYPEQNLGDRPQPKDVDAYLAAINSVFSGK